MITKPFLGTERTAAGRAARKSLPPHVTAVSEELKAAHSRALSEARPVVEKAKPGCLLQLVRGFLLLVVVICGLGAVPMLFSGAIVQVLEMAAVAGVTYLAVKLIDKSQEKKAQKVMASPEYQAAEASLKRIEEAVDAQLGVPKGLSRVDILEFEYELRDGLVANVNGTSYENKTIRAFVEDGLLYIVLSDSKYAFDLDTIVGFRRVDTPIAISGWNKTISYTEPYFQSCGVTSPEDEPGYQTGGYSVLSFESGDTRWELYIPNYETEYFERQTRHAAR